MSEYSYGVYREEEKKTCFPLPFAAALIGGNTWDNQRRKMVVS